MTGCLGLFQSLDILPDDIYRRNHGSMHPPCKPFFIYGYRIRLPDLHRIDRVKPVLLLLIASISSASELLSGVDSVPNQKATGLKLFIF